MDNSFNDSVAPATLAPAAPIAEPPSPVATPAPVALPPSPELLALQEQHAALQAKFTSLQLESAFSLRAQQAGVIDLDAALRLADMSAAKVSDAGVEGIDTVLSDLISKRPYLAPTPVPTPSAPNSLATSPAIASTEAAAPTAPTHAPPAAPLAAVLIPSPLGVATSSLGGNPTFLTVDPTPDQIRAMSREEFSTYQKSIRSKIQ